MLPQPNKEILQALGQNLAWKERPDLAAKQTFAETRRSARRQLDSEFYIG
jgi:hypothetical protein